MYWVESIKTAHYSKLSVVTYTGKTALHFDHLPSARSGQVHSSDAAASAMRPLSDLFWALVFFVKIRVFFNDYLW